MKVQSLATIFDKHYISNANVPAIIIANGVFEGIYLVVGSLIYIIFSMEYIAVAVNLKLKQNELTTN